MSELRKDHRWLSWASFAGGTIAFFSSMTPAFLVVAFVSQLPHETIQMIRSVGIGDVSDSLAQLWFLRDPGDMANKAFEGGSATKRGA